MEKPILDALEKEKKRLSATLFSNKKPSENPKAYILGGQPASGKTRLINLLKTTEPEGENLIVINGDEYRVLHPDYLEICQKYDRVAPNHTQSFANELVEFVKLKCLKEKYSFIIEGTMRSYQTIERTINELISHDFIPELHVLSVPFEESLIGIFERYEYDKAQTGIGRFSPLSTHHEAFEKIPQNIQKASQDFPNIEIKVYNRINGYLPIRYFHSEQSMLFTEWRNMSSLEFKEANNLERWDTMASLANARNESDKEYLTFIKKQIEKYSIR